MIAQARTVWSLTIQFGTVRPRTTRCCKTFVAGVFAATMALPLIATPLCAQDTSAAAAGAIEGLADDPSDGAVDPSAALEGFIETFDDLSWRDRLSVANFDREGSFATGWRRWLASALLPSAPRAGEGALHLRLSPASQGTQKPFFGSQVQRVGPHHFGSYEVYMRAARGEGIVSSFYTYTGPFFGDPHDEIDFEFLGRDTTKVWLNIFTEGDNLPGRWIDLGFDAARETHLYRFDWRPDSVTWYVDDRELLRVTADEHPIPQTPSRLYIDVWAGNAGMREWIGMPAENVRTEAIYHCISYRPPGDDGPTCSDYVASTLD
jgi:hypothetical protein